MSDDEVWQNPKNKGIDFINLSNSTSLFVAMKSKEIDLLLSGSIDEDQKRYLKSMAKQKKIRKGETT